MNEHDTQEQPSKAVGGDGWCEEAGNPAEEPGQRWQDQQRQLRNERIRLLLLCMSMLALLMGLLLDLFVRAYVPLFVVLVVVYLGYRSIDAWLDTHEQPRH
jgi:hypothetical protein